MNWPAYPRYKDTDTAWLGEIPTTWDLRRLGFFFSERKTTVSDRDFQPLSVTKDGIVPQLDTAAKTDNGDNRKLVRAGDFVINSRSDRKGSAGLSPLDGSVSVISTVLEPRGLLGGYVHHLLRSQAFQEEYYRFGSGIVADLWSTRYSAMKMISLPAPPMQEQAAIAAFVDAETAKIDALIAKQEQLIATLREDRTATITHAVTKGLDPDAETKESGIPGLGPIPASWSVRPFLRCVDGRVDYRGATPKKVDDGVLLVTARNVRPGWIDYEISDEYVSAEDYGEVMRRGLPEIDDLLFTMEAPLGNAALVDRTDIALAQRIIKFRPDAQTVLPRYLLYSVIGEWFQSQLVARATGSTALGLKASKLPELRVAVPDMNEQSRIVDFLDERWAKIDELVEKVAEVIETLREYRSALITDAVTGKIDVRGAA